MSLAPALRDLGGLYIASATAPGRGRVERVHRTLQNRLVPQLPRGLADYNARFPQPLKDPEEAHRPLTFKEEELQRIFCRRDKRTLSQNSLFSYRGAR